MAENMTENMAENMAEDMAEVISKDMTEDMERENTEINPENEVSTEPALPELSPARVKSVLESVLFTMGESVEVSRLADVVGLSVSEVKKYLHEMEEDYKREESGLCLLWLESAVQLGTKSSTYEYLIRIAKTPRKYVLSDTVLETLSIIAYRQPVTKLDIERIRGVSCDFAVNKLMEYDLIQELGRKDAPGRPMLFGTTEQFLRSFGVSSLEELPELSPVQVEEFKEQAEAEARATVDI